MILTLDLGSKLGYYKEGDTKAYTLNLGKGDDRFLNLYLFLSGAELKDVKEIAFEAAAFKQGAAIAIYHGMVGILKLYCLEFEIPLTGIPVGTIKKAFTGKGNTNKAGMMARCDELGMKYDDDNAADAYGVYCTHTGINNVNI